MNMMSGWEDKFFVFRVTEYNIGNHYNLTFYFEIDEDFNTIFIKIFINIK